jgi:hypothetical protein
MRDGTMKIPKAIGRTFHILKPFCIVLLDGGMWNNTVAFSTNIPINDPFNWKKVLSLLRRKLNYKYTVITAQAGYNHQDKVGLRFIKKTTAH